MGKKSKKSKNSKEHEQWGSNRSLVLALPVLLLQLLVLLRLVNEAVALDVECVVPVQDPEDTHLQEIRRIAFLY